MSDTNTEEHEEAPWTERAIKEFMAELEMRLPEGSALDISDPEQAHFVLADLREAKDLLKHALATVDAYRAALEAVVEDADIFGWQSSTIQRACALLGTEGA